MGKKVKADWECIYCSYKGVLSSLDDLGYVEQLKTGQTSIYCPKCDCGQIVK